MGLVLYAFVAVGLGCWLKLESRSGLNLFGLRFALGCAAMIIFVHIAQVILRIPGSPSNWIICFLAAGGLVFRLRSFNWRGNLQKNLQHPVCVLLAVGGIAVVANGGVDYLPVTHDEFTHWLGNPIRINAFGSWAAARHSLHLADYTQGWALLIALPWQISGQIDLGTAATAPFILSVATIGIVFDVSVFLARKRLEIGDGKSVLFGWAFILLFMAAETLGALWPTTTLIEPPQILGYTAFLILLFTSEIAKEDERTLELSAGVMLASCYLIKIAATIFVPAILGVFLLRMMLRRSQPGRIRAALISCVRVTGPVLILAISWGMITNREGCIYSPLATLTPDALATAGSLDWRDLADRYTAALWEYISSYKTPLTIAAMIGMVAALARRQYLAPLILGLMGAVYLALLYWYHLSCFGPYNFEHLNSIPRFTRVLLRTFHGLGLILLLDAALWLLARRTGSQKRPPRIPANLVTGWLVFSVIALGAWQMHRVNRSVDIVTSRTGQPIDFRIGEMRQAAAFIESQKSISLPASPILQIVSQGMDSAVRDYAVFFAHSRQRGETTARYRVAPSHSWSPEPINIWQARASQEDVLQKLLQADIIWPTTLDPWVKDVFAKIIDDDKCLRALPGKILVRIVPTIGKPKFTCFDKAAVD